MLHTDADVAGLIVTRKSEGVDTILEGTYEGTPPTTANKFAVGCVIQDITNGIFYVNNGTLAVPTWEDQNLTDEGDAVSSAGVGGNFIKKTALVVYDFAVDGGAAGAIVLADGATLPDNAVVTMVTYDVITTCTSAGADAGTIVLSLPTDGALSTAVAISDGSNPLDAGVHLASVLTPIAVKTTAARAIGVTIATQNFTAGKVVFAVDYYVSQ